jgi:hypothetical protein
MDGKFYTLKGLNVAGIWRVPVGEETFVLDTHKAGYWAHGPWLSTAYFLTAEKLTHPRLSSSVLRPESDRSAAMASLSDPDESMD